MEKQLAEKIACPLIEILERHSHFFGRGGEKIDNIVRTFRYQADGQAGYVQRRTGKNDIDRPLFREKFFLGTVKREPMAADIADGVNAVRMNKDSLFAT